MQTADIHVCVECANVAGDLWLGIADVTARGVKVRALGAVEQAWALFTDGREIGILDLPGGTGICPCCGETKESSFYGYRKVG
jgi:hypothetical protein